MARQPATANAGAVLAMRHMLALGFRNGACREGLFAPNCGRDVETYCSPTIEVLHSRN